MIIDEKLIITHDMNSRRLLANKKLRRAAAVHSTAPIKPSASTLESETPHHQQKSSGTHLNTKGQSLDLRI